MRLVPVVALFAALLVARHGAANAATANVPNEGSGTVSVIDTDTEKVTADRAATRPPRWR
jgi:hypothetical protein